jgi:hypothetical protein
MVLIGIHIFVFVARGAYQRDALPFSLKENKFIIIIIIIIMKLVRSKLLEICEKQIVLRVACEEQAVCGVCP